MSAINHEDQAQPATKLVRRSLLAGGALAVAAQVALPTTAHAEPEGNSFQWFPSPTALAAADLATHQGPVFIGEYRYEPVATAPGHPWAYQSADGRWWLIGEPVLEPQAFGAVADGVSDDSDAINGCSEAAAALGRPVSFPQGLYRHSKTLRFYHGVTYRGAQPLGGWRPARFSSHPDHMFTDLVGATFLATGTGTKDYQLDFVTAGRQCGYDRPNSVRAFGNDFDAEFLMADFTNADAVGTQSATPRRFSAAAAVVGDPWRQVTLENLRFVTSCPGDGQTYGLAGYNDNSSIRPWAEWDIGLYLRSPWRSTFRNIQIVGYWQMRGLLHVNMHPDEERVDQTLGYSELNLYEKCLFQGGASFRSGDIWPVVAQDANSITVRWTPSHQFASSGNVKNRSGAVITYTGTSFDSTQQTLTFTGCNDTSAAPVGSALTCSTNGGISHTVLSGSELYDFSHQTRLDTASPDLGTRRLPYRAALEVSGHPMRAFKMFDSVINPCGPVALHLGCSRNMELISCYSEPKSWIKELGQAESNEPGSLIICGPTADRLPELDSYFGSSITSSGWTIVGNINMQPWKKPNATSRMASMTDVFNPISYSDDKVRFPASDRHTRISTAQGGEIVLTKRSATGTTTPVLESEASGAVTIGGLLELFSSGNAYLPGRVLSDSLALGPRTGARQSISRGTGSPENVVAADVGSLYLRTDGAPGQTLYVKETGTSNTGWAAK